MIRLQNVSKGFRREGRHRAVLQDVNFVLPDSAGLALIGRNGAGKSTLLRLIAGTLPPDRGVVISDEDISWPMGFGGGFHPALTGAQNARFVARLYGRVPEEVEAFARAFSELGSAFRMPVETYSSGMKARLAFALSIGMRFDRYLIDEIIGVGDAAFREKCRAALGERLGGSRLIMVSHNPHALRQFCDAALLIEAGRIWFYPDLEEALAAHTRDLARNEPA